MKKRYFSVLMPAVLAFGLQAGVLDLSSRFELIRHNATLQQSAKAGPHKAVKALAKAGAAASPERTHTLAFVTMADGCTAADLAADGLEVLTSRGRVAIVRVPYAEAEAQAAAPSVKVMQFERAVSTHMDLARQASGTDAIHRGEGDLPRSYTGKGVLTGIVDEGFDPNHINFLDAEGKSRIKYLSLMRYNAMLNDVAPVFYGEDVADASPVSSFTTDSEAAYHGTHTLGILAGGYKGEVEVATGPGEKQKIANPYYGVATDSEIALSCGELSDVLIAYGLDYMLGYAMDYKKLPTVLSLSLGSTIGAHDPQSSMCQFLDEIGKEAIVCLSAGNEGNAKAALHKTLTDDDKMIKTFLHPFAYKYVEGGTSVQTQNTVRYGQLCVYADDDQEFNVRVGLYRRSRNFRSMSYEMPAVGTDTYTFYCTEDGYAQNSTDVVAPANSVYALNFDGFVAIARGIDPSCGRYCCNISMDLLDKEANNLSDEFVVGIEVTGTPGHRYDLWSDAQSISFDDYDTAGFDDGSRNGTISDMAVGHNVLTVGSYNTRQEWLTLDGNSAHYEGDGFRPGYVSDFSSFGTLADGRNLPHVCAPGAAIVSSISNPYLTYLTDALAEQNGVTLTDEMRTQYYEYLNSARATDASGKAYYWKQEVGTSMSTPFVAGNIALWLEADPTLTVADVLEIINATAVRDAQVAEGDPVQWGAGKFDALAGLKEVVRRSGVGTVTTDGTNDRLTVTATAPGRLNVFVGNAASVEATLTALSGATVLSASAQGDELDLDTSAVAPGVYLLRANGHTQKVVVK